ASLARKSGGHVSGAGAGVDPERTVEYYLTAADPLRDIFCRAPSLGGDMGCLGRGDLVLPYQRHGHGRHRAPGCLDDRAAISEDARIAVVVGEISAFR